MGALLKQVGPGRPTLFDDELAEAILEFAKDPNVTDVKIAKHFDIAVSTLNLWKGKYPTFSEALKAAKQLGKQVGTGLVRASMFKMAIGYSLPDIHFSAYEGEVTATPFTKVVGPSFQAAQAWLRAHDPGTWNEVKKLEHTVKVELPTIQEAKQILDADYAMLPAQDVKVEDL